MLRLARQIPAFFAPFTATFKCQDEKLNKVEEEVKELKKKVEDIEGIKIEVQELKTNFDGLNMDLAKIISLNVRLAEIIQNRQTKINCAMEGMKKEFVEAKTKLGNLREDIQNRPKIEEIYEKKSQQLKKEEITEKKIHQSNEGRWSRVKLPSIGNKWNVKDAGQNLAFRENALVVICSGTSEKWSTVRGQTPVPQLNLNRKSQCITGYYEVEIVKHIQESGIRIGFCDKQFPLDYEDLRVGNAKYSIGIRFDEALMVNGSKTSLCKDKPSGKFFEEGNIIGCGLIYSPEDPSLQCFITLNGGIIGIVDLPLHFVNVVLYPAVSLYYSGVLVKANFGQENWRFDPTQLLKE